MSHKLAARTYVDASGTKVVPEDSPDAASLLGVEGDEIDDDRAKALGLGSRTSEARSESAPAEPDAPEEPSAPKRSSKRA